MRKITITKEPRAQEGTTNKITMKKDTIDTTKKTNMVVLTTRKTNIKSQNTQSINHTNSLTRTQNLKREETHSTQSIRANLFTKIINLNNPVQTS